MRVHCGWIARYLASGVLGKASLWSQSSLSTALYPFDHSNFSFGCCSISCLPQMLGHGKAHSI